ncbi:hypothetical protein RRG08_048448 [Elysia crispata]|uniref:Uncharacterized protein n=1 Tax=Elysia crispata TaxID=231223 RepID=A0AAE1BAJ9_9GAST|nr:hypothetical protein RRG08_048448 [Elysia crispata]
MEDVYDHSSALRTLTSIIYFASNRSTSERRRTAAVFTHLGRSMHRPLSFSIPIVINRASTNQRARLMRWSYTALQCSDRSPALWFTGILTFFA